MSHDHDEKDAKGELAAFESAYSRAFGRLPVTDRVGGYMVGHGHGELLMWRAGRADTARQLADLRNEIESLKQILDR